MLADFSNFSCSTGAKSITLDPWRGLECNRARYHIYEVVGLCSKLCGRCTRMFIRASPITQGICLDTPSVQAWMMRNVEAYIENAEGPLRSLQGWEPRTCEPKLLISRRFECGAMLRESSKPLLKLTGPPSR